MKINLKFEKVSFEQFKNDFSELVQDETRIKEIYDNLNLPRRKTKGSAGYDFESPLDFTLNPGETIKIPTGIRVFIEEEYFLAIFPRSSLGFKYRLQLDNTVGIIDSDYYYAKNEGHIMVKITNDSKDKVLNIKASDGFCQGIFLKYYVGDDVVLEERTGGFGSTNK